MKKIFLFITVASTAFFASCSNDDDVNTDYDTYPESFDITNVDFTAGNNYSYLVPLDPPIFNSDVVLVYRRTVDDGFSVWQSIPRTLYLDAGDEIDYDFNFTADDVSIFMGSNFDLALAPEFTQNQTFRIVLVPAFVAQNIDTDNYDAVMSALQDYKNGGVPSIEQ
ncbi:MAG: hypothetical protein ACO1N9_11365 [Flavobacterium sp.]